jgi:isocitrate lyase
VHWAKKLDKTALQSFIQDLGRAGYVWTFVTLAGLHADTLAAIQLARAFQAQGMLGYAQEVQETKVTPAGHTLTVGSAPLLNRYESLLRFGRHASSTARVGNKRRS